ncbi:MAG TPA: hypothetical protein VMT18_14390, partial [Planctomycetota bacterium]|nr:hypothetical protein [Planctomycetota bacterium]
MKREGSFYIGWQARAAPEAARFTRAVVLLLVLAGLAVAAAWAASQRTWQPAGFEFGVERAFEGVYQHTPVPHLRVARPGADAGESRWLLVAPGKHGAEAAWATHDGLRVALRGSLVFRAEGTLVEVAPASLRELGPAPSAAPVEHLGHVALRGEIVDSKCWLGVMNPGNLRTHRACATLCVRGGIPPLFVVRTPDAGLRQAVLVGPRGEALNESVL